MADMPAHKHAENFCLTPVVVAGAFRRFGEDHCRGSGQGTKTLRRAEVDRAISTFTIASEEVKRIHGETFPLDAVPSGEGYFGFWVAVPLA